MAGRYIRVKVRFLGALVDDVQIRETELVMDPETATVGNLLELLKSRIPKFREAEFKLPMIWVFINDKQVLNTAQVKDGDRVSLMPPMYEGG